MLEGLAEAGATVIVNGVNKERVSTTAAELRAKGHKVHEAAFDVTDDASVVAAFNQFDAEGIDVDILINNAGIQLRKAHGGNEHGRVEQSHRHQPDQRICNRSGSSQTHDPAWLWQGDQYRLADQ